jgi:hypothetical protein
MSFSMLNLFNSKKQKRTKKLTKKSNSKIAKQNNTKTKNKTKNNTKKKTKCCKWCGGRYWGTSDKCESGFYPKCKESGCKKK